jgi:hypothetical protein
MSREDAIPSAQDRLEEAGYDFRFGKPSQDDLLQHAADIVAQIGIETGYSLSMEAGDEGISFSLRRASASQRAAPFAGAALSGTSEKPAEYRGCRLSPC